MPGSLASATVRRGRRLGARAAARVDRGVRIAHAVEAACGGTPGPPGRGRPERGRGADAGRSTGRSRSSTRPGAARRAAQRAPVEALQLAGDAGGAPRARAARGGRVYEPRADPRRGRGAGRRPASQHGRDRRRRRRRRARRSTGTSRRARRCERGARASARGAQDITEPTRRGRDAAVPGAGTARPRPAARARGHARARRGARRSWCPTSSSPRRGGWRGAGRALRRRHRRLAPAAPRRLGGVPRRGSRRRRRSGRRSSRRGCRRSTRGCAGGCPAASWRRCGCAAACSGCCCASARRSASLEEIAQQGAARWSSPTTTPTSSRRPAGASRPPPRRRSSRTCSRRGSPGIAGAQIAGGVLPSYEVGGDWFDFVENRDGAWLAIADAVGHAARRAAGLGASRSARCAPRGAAGRTSRRRCRAMHETVRRLGKPDFFVSALVARWRAADATLSWVNCGHPPPYLVKADGDLVELAAPEPRARPAATSRRVRHRRAPARRRRPGDPRHRRHLSRRRRAAGVRRRGHPRALRGRSADRGRDRDRDPAPGHRVLAEPLEDDATVAVLAIA